MNYEYVLYIFLPVILGFVGEKYKDMNTGKYSFFIAFVFFVVYLLIFFMEGGSFIPDKIQIGLIAFGIIFSTLLFHIQKKVRRIK